MKHILLTKRLREILPLIIIDESAKKEFIELMEWDEKKFKENTLKIGD